MKRLFVLLSIVLSSTLLSAQGTMLLRQPTLNEQNIVFVYANDLWITNLADNRTIRLTTSVGEETNPHFSPDGQWIAFTGQYDGNPDVYLLPVSGGEPVRLTWHPGYDQVEGWMPDGKSVIFASARMGQPTKGSRLYTIDIEGGTPEPLPPLRAQYGEISTDGKFLAYQPFGEWDSEWRNYRGGQAQPIWILNLEDLSLIQTPRSDNERHISPVWYGDRIFFLSELDFASNIWSYNPATNDLKQHTFHGDFDVKSLDADKNNIVYEQGGTLHLLDPVSDKITDLKIEVIGDFHWSRTRWQDIPANNFTNADISPTGQRALMEYRGDIFTIPKEKGNWRNLTESPGVADRFPIWSPKGDKIAWFSDKSGEYRLMIADQSGMDPKEIPLPNPTFYFRPDWSPDGAYIAYTDTDYNLWYVNLESGLSKKVDTERYAHPSRTLNPSWSPDSKWIAYTKLADNHFKVVKVHNIETGITSQLTNDMADAMGPVWDKSGKYLYFLASTNFGQKSGWLDMSNYDVEPTRSLYMIILNNEDPSPFLPESDEENKDDTSTENAKESKGKDKKDKAKEDKGKKGKKDEDEEEEDVKVIIDMENIERRILAIDVPNRDYAFTLGGPENTIFFGERIENKPGFTLHKYDLKEKESKEFMTELKDVIISFDREQLLYKQGSTWGIVSATASSAKAGDGSLKMNEIKYKVVPAEEWKQIFKEGWRFQRDFLYVENVHGAPWDKVYNWYAPWVEHVRHRNDLNYLVDILGGEVAVGHSFTRGGDYPKVPSIAIGLLGADYKIENGLFRISKIYNSETWNPGLTAPLSVPGLDIKEGDYLLSVNGEKLTADMNIYQLFEGTAGLQTTLTVNEANEGDNERKVIVVPVSNENALRSTEWVESNRRKVDELSGGKLAYVYLPNTGFGGFINFNRYYFSQLDKKGAIIDERNNSGGSAADYMVDIMNRELHGYFNSNAGDKRPFTSPTAGIYGPKVMIINERAGSGGDYLPYMFHKMEIGPMVGTTTWGGLVGTWDTPRFIDGGMMVAPRGGFYDINGEWAVEGIGVSPDIEVIQDPLSVISGHDPQLERAVKVALELLEKESFELQPEPAAPIRWKRPDYFKIDE